jgi:hypothetical protein
MRVTVILKTNGWKYSGELISETDKILIIDDFKLGRIELLKSELAMRGDF